MSRIDLYQLDDFNDDFAPNKVDGSVPVWDGVNSRFKPLPYPTGVFGTEFQKFESQGLTVTSSTSFINKISGTTSVLPVGTYRAVISFNWNSSSISDNIFVRFLFDGSKPGHSVENNEMMRAEAPDSSGGSWSGTGSRQKYPITRVFYMNVTTAGAKSVSLAFRGDDRNQEFSMWDALIEIIRVA